jgi:thiol-disulfide isomerase/thioredoxin
MRAAKFLSAVLCAAALTVPTAWAATSAPFTQPEFAAAQHDGKPILVEITASWCPVCAKQRPILAQMLAEPAFKDWVVYNVDFDTQKDVVRAMGAQMQSTLIVFHGNVEKGRSTGETNAAAIRSLVEKAGS